MPTPSTHRLRRPLALLLALATALSGLALAATTSPAGAEPLSINGGYIEWGIKQSFRSYVMGPIGAGTVSLSSSIASPPLAPVTRAGIVSAPVRSSSSTPLAASDVYRFGVVATGTSDSQAQTANVSSGGVVRFQAHFAPVGEPPRVDARARRRRRQRARQRHR